MRKPDLRTTVEFLFAIAIMASGVITGIQASTVSIIAVSFGSVGVFGVMYLVTSLIDTSTVWSWWIGISMSLAAFNGAMWVSGLGFAIVEALFS